MYTPEDKRAIWIFVGLVALLVSIPIACGDRRMGHDESGGGADELDEYHSSAPSLP